MSTAYLILCLILMFTGFLDSLYMHRQSAINDLFLILIGSFGSYFVVQIEIIKDLIRNKK